jgi:hypothetical protein
LASPVAMAGEPWQRSAVSRSQLPFFQSLPARSKDFWRLLPMAEVPLVVAHK